MFTLYIFWLLSKSWCGPGRTQVSLRLVAFSGSLKLDLSHTFARVPTNLRNGGLGGYLGGGLAVAVYILTIGLFNLALGYGIALWFEHRQRVAVWRQSVLGADIGLSEISFQDATADKLAETASSPDDVASMPPSPTGVGETELLAGQFETESADTNADIATTVPAEVGPHDNDIATTPDQSSALVTSDVAQALKAGPSSLLSDESFMKATKSPTEVAVDSGSSIGTDPLFGANLEAASEMSAETVDSTDDVAAPNVLGDVDERVHVKKLNDVDEQEDVDLLVAAFDVSWQQSNACDDETLDMTEQPTDRVTGYPMDSPDTDAPSGIEATSNSVDNASTDKTREPLASSTVVEALTTGLAEEYSDDLERPRNYLFDFNQRLNQVNKDAGASSWTTLIQEFDTGIQTWPESQQTTIEQMDETSERFGDLGPRATPIEETSLELTALLGALSFSLTSATLDLDRQTNRDSLADQ